MGRVGQHSAENCGFSPSFPVSSHRESLQDVLGLIVRKIKWKIVNIDSYRIIGRDGT